MVKNIYDSNVTQTMPYITSGNITASHTIQTNPVITPYAYATPRT